MDPTGEILCMKFYWLILGVLAVWRVTHFLQAEDGPGEVVVRLRRAAGGGFWGRLLDCFYCLSVWVAAPTALLLGEDWLERFFLWLALSAGAIFLEKIFHTEPDTLTAWYFEEEEMNDALLRESEETTSNDPSPPVFP